MICDKCGSKNTEWTTVDKNRHFLTILKCRDCGEERLPTPEERENFN